MQDSPDPDAILASIADWLRSQAAAALPPHASFEAKVAAGAIDLVRRQIASQDVDADESARLSAFLDAQGDPATLIRTLCDRIEKGEVDLSTPGLAGLLVAATLDKIDIDQPGFPAARRLRTLAEHT